MLGQDLNLSVACYIKETDLRGKKSKGILKSEPTLIKDALTSTKATFHATINRIFSYKSILTRRKIVHKL